MDLFAMDADTATRIIDDAVDEAAFYFEHLLAEIEGLQKEIEKLQAENSTQPPMRGSS